MEKSKLEPWLIPTNVRVREIKEALSQGKKVAVMLQPKVDLASSFRYRAYNIYQATKLSKKWQLVYFLEDEVEILTEVLPEVQLLILGRIPKWQPKLDELALLAHAKGIKIAYDLDDCVCGTKYVKSMFNAVSPDVIDQEYWISTCANFELISYLADGFMVTNDYLGKVLSEAHEKKPYQVIRNFLNEEQIVYSQELLENAPEKEKGFTIGYFSGSHTHAVDFEMVYPELLQLLKDYSDTRLKIVGMLKLPESANEFIKNGQIEYRGMVDFLTLQKEISEVDVNIAPLSDNVFSNCKSELKYFEAGLVEVPTVASPTYAYEKAIDSGKNGILCQPGEWYDAILKLYRDVEYGEKIGETAKTRVLETYAPEACIKQIEEAYDFYEKL